MIRYSKILFFAVVTISLAWYVYVYEYKKSESQAALNQSRILKFDPNQVSYFQIVKQDVKIALQKTESGWKLQEPIFESADNDRIEETQEKYGEAPKVTSEAMREEMERDASVFIMGEEVGHYNGAYKVSKGLLEEFGEMRVVDTPITELGFAGVGVAPSATLSMIASRAASAAFRPDS